MSAATYSLVPVPCGRGSESSSRTRQEASSKRPLVLSPMLGLLRVRHI